MTYAVHPDTVCTVWITHHKSLLKCFGVLIASARMERTTLDVIRSCTAHSKSWTCSVHVQWKLLVCRSSNVLERVPLIIFDPLISPLH